MICKFPKPKLAAVPVPVIVRPSCKVAPLPENFQPMSASGWSGDWGRFSHQVYALVHMRQDGCLAEALAVAQEIARDIRLELVARRANEAGVSL